MHWIPSQSSLSSYSFCAERKHSDLNFSMAFVSFKISTFYAHNYKIPRDQRSDHASFGYGCRSEQHLNKGKVYFCSLPATVQEPTAFLLPPSPRPTSLSLWKHHSSCCSSLSAVVTENLSNSFVWRCQRRINVLHILWLLEFFSWVHFH